MVTRLRDVLEFVENKWPLSGAESWDSVGLVSGAPDAEIRRILKPGGMHVWTVPIGLPPPAETRARVDTSGREDRMLLEPIYHGSGSDGLSLVYTDFGRDIGRLLAGIGLPTQAARHVVGEDGHVAGVTFVSVRQDEEAAAS